MKITVWAALVLLAGQFIPYASATQADQDYLIVPGRSLGRYTLDRSLDAYLRDLGGSPQLTQNLPMPGTHAYFWRERGLAVWVRDQQVIQLDIVTRRISQAYRDGDAATVALQQELEKFKTDKGVTLDLAAEQVKTAAGEPDYTRSFPESAALRITGWVYKRLGGLYLEVESKATPGTVIRIGVFNPATPNWW